MNNRQFALLRCATKVTPAELADQVRQEFRERRRKFAAGLAVAFADFLRDLDAIEGKFPSFREFTDHFELQRETADGSWINTLTVKVADKTQSIRPYYNAIEGYFRAEKKRFGYPNAAPHATQAWLNYISWVDAMLQFSSEELAQFRKLVVEFVLQELPSHEIEPGDILPIRRPFSRFLEEFNFVRQKGEPNGAAFQGAAYAFLRADSPHLQLDISKVNAGSKRLNRVGDIDGWQGEKLVLSSEVKHYTVSDTALDALKAFSNATQQRNAFGIIVADRFTDTASEQLKSEGLRILSREDMIVRVDIWDPIKQQAGVDAFLYYICHVEMCMPLMQRTKKFFEQIDLEYEREIDSLRQH